MHLVTRSSLNTTWTLTYVLIFSEVIFVSFLSNSLLLLVGEIACTMTSLFSTSFFLYHLVLFVFIFNLINAFSSLHLHHYVILQCYLVLDTFLSFLSSYFPKIMNYSFYFLFISFCSKAFCLLFLVWPVKWFAFISQIKRDAIFCFFVTCKSLSFFFYKFVFVI